MRVTLNQKFKTTILSVVLFLVGFTIPSSSAPNSIAIILLVLLSFLCFQPKQFFSELIKNKIFLLFFVFAILKFVAIFYSFDRNVALDRFIKSGPILIFLPFAIINFKDSLSKKVLKITFFGLLFGVLLNLITIYFRLLTVGEIDFLFREQFINQGMYSIHVPYMSMLVLICLIWSYKVRFSKSDNLNSIIRLVIMGLLFISLIFLSGLMSFFILVIFVLSIVFSFVKRRYIVLIMSSLVIAGASLIGSLKNYELESVRGGENLIYKVATAKNTFEEVRLQNWNSVLQVFSDHPFVGVGVDGGVTELLKFRTPLTEPFVNMHNAHNDFLEILLQLGLVGCICFVLIIKGLIQKSIKVKSFFFTWFLIVFLLSGLTESLLQRQIGIVFFTFFTSIFVLLPYNDPDPKVD